MKLEKDKAYEVKEWFANKVANEVKRNINMCKVFAILKETDKAVYAMLNLGTDFHKTMWIPKSVIVEDETGYPVIYSSDYDRVRHEFYARWSMFK